MPASAAAIIAKWIDYFCCEFKISKSRNTKLGDYRHPFKNKGHKISVNNNLNPYAFLITTVHEFAHLLTYNEYQNKVKPHGAEWKQNFKKMMKPFFEKEVFPADVRRQIITYLDNPAASSCTDLELARILKQYDEKQGQRVEELPVNTIFKLKGGQRFKKGERVRKRYRCTRLDDGRVYLFNSLAEVFPV